MILALDFRLMVNAGETVNRLGPIVCWSEQGKRGRKSTIMQVSDIVDAGVKKVSVNTSHHAII